MHAMNRAAVCTVLAVSLSVATGCFDSMELDGDYCPDPRYAGDGKSGLQCWGPPENYCKDGIIDSEIWFCKVDSTICCRNEYSDCFHCGWVNMTECSLNDAPSESDPPDCDAIRDTLPFPYGKCVDTDATDPDCQAILYDPECGLDVDVQVCR